MMSIPWRTDVARALRSVSRSQLFVSVLPNQYAHFENLFGTTHNSQHDQLDLRVKSEIGDAINTKYNRLWLKHLWQRAT